MSHVFDNFINGVFVKPSGNDYIDSINPANGTVLAKVANSSEQDVNVATDAAVLAFQSWSTTTPQYRSKVMLRIADIIESRLDEFAKMESQDQGKPVSLAKSVDIPRAVYNFRFFATSILHRYEKCSEQHEPVKAINYVHRKPIGVTGLISPWNLPIYLLTWKIAPAIAAGNTCVCKPSEFTSGTAWLLGQVLMDAGLPAGVVNIVFGYGHTVGEAIVTHPKVPLISFTGSTTIGHRIQAVSAPQCKKLSLELGGKNAAVVFADVDLDKCVKVTERSSFANQGEICLCTSRIYVHESIFDKFLSRFVEATKKVVVGLPDDNNTIMGPLVSKQHYEKVIRYIQLASKLGGKIHCGSGVTDLHESCKSGYFIPPTVITGLENDSACLQEEIFGPVTCILPFKTEEEAIKLANDVQYGLAATLWTNDLSRAHRVSHALEAGTVWVNCWMVRDLRMPFGGMKQSGIGREDQEASYDFFTEPKTVCIKL